MVAEGPGVGRAALAGLFRRAAAARRGPADVSHFDVQERFVELARKRRAQAPAVVINRPQLGEKQFGVLQLITAYRIQGARHADLDPSSRQEKPAIPELDPAFYGLTEADMDMVFNTGTLVGPREVKLPTSCSS